MADAYVGNRIKKLNISPEFVGYSRVVIYTGQEDADGNKIYYEAGNASGRTLEITNPWANQTLANNVLARIQGWVYQPYEAEGARLTPAAEMGDSVTVSDIYSGIYSRELSFTSLYKPTIKAPYDEEIDHEYGYETHENRQYTRQFNEISASLLFYSNEITAKVSKTGGNNSTFGWTLTDNKWSVYSNNKEVFRVNSSGAVVEGTIRASSGMIGGFTIGSNAIYNNISSFGGNQSTGVYVGTNGIQCGNKFKVDSAGNLTASTGTFTGSVYAKNIQYGGSYGTFSGSGITGSSIGTGALTSGINSSLGFANFSNDVFNNNTQTNYMKTKTLTATVGAELKGLQVNNNYLYVGGSQTTNKATWKSLSVCTSVSVNASPERVIDDVNVTNVQRNANYGITYFSLDLHECTVVGSINFSQSKETIYYLGR